MCIGQVGNLLPHVTLSANLAQHLMPEWGLSAAEGGLMASGYAFGYMLAVPVLTTLTDRVDARIVLLWGSIARVVRVTAPLLSLFVLPALYLRFAPAARCAPTPDEDLLQRWAGPEPEPIREREEEKA